jgi:hypothetical protein
MIKAGLLIFALILYGFTAGCQTAKPDKEKTAEKFKSEPRADAGFREVKAGNAVILIISVQEEFAVTLEGEESLLKDVKTKVEGETLIIKTGGNISPANKIRLKISMPELTGLELWGTSEATITNVKSNSLKIQTGASSRVKVDGETKSLNANANGTSWIDAENLKAENAEARTAGTSEITVSAASELYAEALGGSTIFYTGDPKNLKQGIAGTGEIRKK